MRRASVVSVASLLVAVGLIFTALHGPMPPAGPTRADADQGTRLDEADRARSFTYDPAVPAEVQGWIATAVDRVHPAARRLIDAVDGQIVVHLHPPHDQVAGFVRTHPDHFQLSLDAETLRNYGQEIRDHVITHELGHVVDIALVPPGLNRQLDVGVPRIGGCTGEYADAGCAPPTERFADTFAKWALNDPVVLSGVQSVGYRVAPPANLALWGEPLVDLPA